MMHLFDKYDWAAYAGAEKFPDGSEPYAGEYGPLVVIVDNTGLQAFVIDYEDQAAFVGRSNANLEYLLDVAERILADCKGLSPRQILRHLKDL